MAGYVGGQAVIEGVMMKFEDRIAVAVRDPSGKVRVKREKMRFRESRVPFVRGIVNLFLVMYIGVKTLNFSSDVALGREEKRGNVSLVFSLLLALVFAVGLFKFLPLLVAQLVDSQVGVGSFAFNLIDGGVRFLVLIGYIAVISRLEDVRRVFQYHGAEHKAVNCYESGKELTVKNVQSFTTVHKRCGTTFVFLVLMVGILVYMFIPKDLAFVDKLGLRLLFLPLIASVSYEILRLGARHEFWRPLLWPGMLVQRLTTREPDDSQVEVAIKALKAVV